MEALEGRGEETQARSSFLSKNQAQGPYNALTVSIIILIITNLGTTSSLTTTMQLSFTGF